MRRGCRIGVVNPAQFGPSEDYEHYPRDLTKDTALLTDYNVDYILRLNRGDVSQGFSTYVMSAAFQSL